MKNRVREIFIPLFIALIMGALVFWIDALMDDIKFLKDRTSFLENKLWQAELDTLHLQRRIDRLNFLYNLKKIKIKSLKTELESYKTDEYYLAIDAQACRFQLRKGNKVIRSGNVAVGKGTTWVQGKKRDFATPTGELKIKNKIIGPWWRRPDWYWKERGMQVPDTFIWIDTDLPRRKAIEKYQELSPEQKRRVRYVPGTLGRYALNLGAGVFIHFGTGRGGRVSHGCIRMSREDLDAVFRVLDVGDPIFIY